MKIMITFRRNRDELLYQLVHYEIAENKLNIAVISYVEQNITEKIDIKELNKQIKDIVSKQNELRDAIDEIVLDLEGGQSL